MCGKIFSTEAQLKKHNRMHTDDSSLLPDDPDTTTKPQNDQATDPDLISPLQKIQVVSLSSCLKHSMLGLKVVFLTGVTGTELLTKCDFIISNPEKWDVLCQR